MYNSIKEFKAGNINVEIFGTVSDQQLENIEKSIKKAFINFNTAFYDGQEYSTAQKINIYASNTKDEYKELLDKNEIENSKRHEYSALKDDNNKKFDVYFYLNRSQDFAYLNLEREIARALTESNDVWKKALPVSFKTGMVSYVAGLDKNHEVDNRNSDCRDFNKIIEKNLSPYEILKNQNNEAQAEQVIKYLKQENPEKISTLFKELTDIQNSKAIVENLSKQSKGIVEKFLNELKDDEGLNENFSEWTNEQLEQFHQKLAEKFVPKMESVTTGHGTEVIIKHHQNSKIKVEDIKKSVIDTLTNFKNAFCSSEECNIPKKFNVFSFDSEASCRQYLCGNDKKFGKFFISNDKSGEASIYLYPNKEGSNVDTLKQWVIETVMENNGWDHLPQKFRDGVKNYILDLSDDSYKNDDLNEIKSSSFTPHNIMDEFSVKGHLSGQVMRFLMENKPDDIHQLLKDFNGLQIKDAEKVKWIVGNFMDKLKHCEQDFSNWVNEQLSQNAESQDAVIQAREEESALINQTQEQSIEGEKQDFIDQVMNSSCITDLGIKPECKDKLQDLIKALKECNEEPSLVPEELKQDESEEKVVESLKKE